MRDASFGLPGYDAWKLAGPPEEDPGPALPSFDIEVSLVIHVDGDDFVSVDYDHDPALFKRTLAGEATDAIRIPNVGVDFDLIDWKVVDK